MVVIDMFISDMTGFEFAQTAIKLYGTKIILATGYSSEDTVRVAKEIGISTVLKKPLPPEKPAQNIFNYVTQT